MDEAVRTILPPTSDVDAYVKLTLTPPSAAEPMGGRGKHVESLKKKRDQLTRLFRP